jgi:two-component system, response regulator
MVDNIILLVEDNPDDEALTLRALRKNNIRNQVIVVRDGVEALDFLFCRGHYADRDSKDLPVLVLLDLRLPKVDGLDVLRRIRADEHTRLLPVAILTSSNADQDFLAGYTYGVNTYIHKPVKFIELVEAVRHLNLYMLVLNEFAHL